MEPLNQREKELIAMIHLLRDELMYVTEKGNWYGQDGKDAGYSVILSEDEIESASTIIGQALLCLQKHDPRVSRGARLA